MWLYLCIVLLAAAVIFAVFRLLRIYKSRIVFEVYTALVIALLLLAIVYEPVHAGWLMDPRELEFSFAGLYVLLFFYGTICVGGVCCLIFANVFKKEMQLRNQLAVVLMSNVLALLLMAVVAAGMSDGL